ncbi:MAG: hypothetical protein NDJ90_11385, partial [Oligoflexia bacterium]|nr:hypothetical protein [Oligoflexia bacterium]
SDQIINHFKIDLSNQSSASLEVLLAPDAAAVATGFELVTQLNPVSVPAGEARRVDFFVRFPKERLSSGQASLRMKIEARSPSEAAPPFSQEEELRLVGPFY